MSNNSHHIKTNLEKSVTERFTQNFEEQISEAAGIIVEIDTVDSHKAFLKVQGQIHDKYKIGRFVSVLVRIAAILFIPMLIASGLMIYKITNRLEKQQFVLQEITSPPGIRSRILLADGTKVWLNAESTIKFKIPFDPKMRDVTLSGEAFFDVQKNPDAPFVVRSGNVDVTVLGTRFNFKAFDDENNIEVVLAEGKVNFNTNRGNNGEEIIMEPGERAVYNKTSNSTLVTTENIGKYIAWHTGKLVFDETPMTDVATQLERWFGIEVVIEDPKILNYKMTTTFENESLHQVLDLLQLSSPIEIEYVLAKIDKNNRTQSKSRIIFRNKKIKP